MKNILKTTLAMFLTGVLATSCDSYKDTDTPDSFVEPDKNLSGVWQLSKVKRNNIDITSSMDFSQFRLYLNSDYRYELENRLPFPVETDGAKVFSGAGLLYRYPGPDQAGLLHLGPHQGAENPGFPDRSPVDGPGRQRRQDRFP